MNRRPGALSVLVALTALTAFTASCSSNSTSSASVPAPVATAPATTAPQTSASSAADATGGSLAPTANIEIKQFKFGPNEVHIAVGGTVTWTNSDNQKHTATDSGAFDTAAIEAGATGTATFDTAGTFAYVCSFHPFMKGTVVVGS